MMTSQSADRLAAICPDASDALLEALYGQCEDDLLAICFLDAVPEGAASVLEQMVVIRYNRLRAEGLNSASFNGFNESYMGDYPEHLKRAMYRFRKVKSI